MDDSIDPCASITDNIAKIDSLHEQHRLEKLREQIDTYNYYHSGDPLQCDASDPIEIILRLWSRDIEIPPELTFGEPYDPCFKRYIRRCLCPEIATRNILLLFKHTELLSSFLVFCYQRLFYSGDRHDASRDIWEQLPSINQGEQWPRSVRLLVARLKHVKLLPLDLVYIAVRIPEHGGTYAHSALEDFFEIARM